MDRMKLIAKIAGMMMAAVIVQAAPKPNIVFIMVDDLGWQDVNCYYEQLHGETSLYETPNMDRVAGQGMRFMQAYSPSPTCAPSRSAYLTGQFGVKNGVWHVKGNRVPRAWGDKQEINPFYSARLNPSQTVIPNVLKKAGYTTAHVGKWHVCGENMVPTPLQMGFDFSFGRDHVYNDPDIVDPNDPKLNNKEGIYSMPKPTRLDAFDDDRFLPLLDDERPYDSLTDVSVRWLNKVGRKDAPFFLNFCPKLVHGPIHTRDRKRLEHYCNKMGIDFPPAPGAICDPDAPGFNNPYYASMVDSADWMVGQVVKTLESIDDPRNPGHKLIDNTYLIITSDNGNSQQLASWAGLDGKKRYEKVTDATPLRGGKTWMYEGGVRIPMIVMGPGIQSGVVNQATPVHLLDMFPTFMAMAGAEDESLDLDGCNILPLFRDEVAAAQFADGSARDTLLFHHPMDDKSFSVIQQGNWKLMKNTAPYRTQAPDLQLYKLNNDDGSFGDLGEANNLVEEYPEVANRMAGELEAWMAKNDARVPYLNPLSKEKLPGQEKVPAVIKTGSEKTRLWATFETDGKAEVKKVFFLYSLNGGMELKFRAPRLEEWFEAPAALKAGRVEADAPPGMTHGIFCLVDENNFLIYSDTVPVIGRECRIDGPVSTFLKDGFAWHPGLLSLIQVGEQASIKLHKKGVATRELDQAICAAKATCGQPVEEMIYAVAMRTLRHAIRAFDGQVPEAALPDLNSLELGKW